MATTSNSLLKSTEVNNEHVNISVEDLEALLNENWDDFNLDSEPPACKAPEDKSNKESFKQIMNKIEIKILAKQKRKWNKKFELFSMMPIKVNDELEEDMDVLPPHLNLPRTKKGQIGFLGAVLNQLFQRLTLVGF
ncbi:hypothetical protein NQ317_017309 [Molorchus minor]|uniref:Uncharacterized protein n=1 Tax=Molorchus minor TaxID=1323400 RepID=A0ABQ9K0G8_9CUCU|nr:hypothetical protein NQ317_017309 [Molorchus minor]